MLRPLSAAHDVDCGAADALWCSVRACYGRRAWLCFVVLCGSCPVGLLVMYRTPTRCRANLVSSLRCRSYIRNGIAAHFDVAPFMDAVTSCEFEGNSRGRASA